jgi:hypothetical protein
MSITSHAGCARSRTVALRALMGLAVLIPIGACSSGGSAGASGTTAATTAETCQQVSTVLTNGPDPGTDPVGYAEAQILPLRQVRAADAALGQAVVGLADAYSSYSAADGTSKTATATLTAAIKQINSLCPGAGATP